MAFVFIWCVAMWLITFGAYMAAMATGVLSVKTNLLFFVMMLVQTFFVAINA